MSHQKPSAKLAVLCRIGTQLCAVPIEHVAETMRPLPIEPLAGMPPFVLGVAVIRDAATPVIHAGRLMGIGAAQRIPTRFLTLKVGERRVALAVDAIVDVLDLGTLTLGGLPPLLQDSGAEVVAAVGTLDSDLLLLLRSARLVPESLWAAFESGATR
jgi:purine-binding chemotaxis protein CheW